MRRPWCWLEATALSATATSPAGPGPGAAAAEAAGGGGGWRKSPRGSPTGRGDESTGAGPCEQSTKIIVAFSWASEPVRTWSSEIWSPERSGCGLAFGTLRSFTYVPFWLWSVRKAMRPERKISQCRELMRGWLKTTSQPFSRLRPRTTMAFTSSCESWPPRGTSRPQACLGRGACGSSPSSSNCVSCGWVASDGPSAMVWQAPGSGEGRRVAG